MGRLPPRGVGVVPEAGLVAIARVLERAPSPLQDVRLELVRARLRAVQRDAEPPRLLLRRLALHPRLRRRRLLRLEMCFGLGERERVLAPLRLAIPLARLRVAKPSRRVVRDAALRLEQAFALAQVFALQARVAPGRLRPT